MTFLQHQLPTRRMRGIIKIKKKYQATTFMSMLTNPQTTSANQKYRGSDRREYTPCCRIQQKVTLRHSAKPLWHQRSALIKAQSQHMSPHFITPFQTTIQWDPTVYLTNPQPSWHWSRGHTLPSRIKARNDHSNKPVTYLHPQSSTAMVDLCSVII